MYSKKEIDFYEYLFNTNKTKGNEFINGGEVVSLFLKAKLQKEILKQIWDVASLRKDKTLNKEEFFLACRNVALAQIGRPLSNILANNINNNIPLPIFEGILYIPMNTNNNTNGEDDDEFVSIEDEPNKAIKPKETIQQAEINLLNNLMKEYAVGTAIDEKKKMEEIKRKADEEEKKKKDEEMKKQYEEFKPKKNLDDLFNLLGDLPGMNQPQKQEVDNNNNVSNNNNFSSNDNNVVNVNVQQNIDNKEVNDDDDDFISVGEDNPQNEDMQNKDNVVNNDTNVNAINNFNFDQQPPGTFDLPKNVTNIFNENRNATVFTNNMDIGLQMNNIQTVSENIINNNTNFEFENENTKEKEQQIYVQKDDQQKQVTLNSLMDNFDFSQPPQQHSDSNTNEFQSQQQFQQNEIPNQIITEQQNNLNDDDFCEVEEDKPEEEQSNKLSIEINNNKISHEIEEIAQEKPIENQDETENNQPKQTENEKPQEEIKKPSILELTPLDFLNEFKKEISPQQQPTQTEQATNDENPFEFVEVQEDIQETSTAPKQIEDPLEIIFKPPTSEEKFISNLTLMQSKIISEIQINIEYLEEINKFAQKKITKSLINSNKKLIDFINGTIHLLLVFNKLSHAANYLKLPKTASEHTKMYNKAYYMILELSESDNFKEIIDDNLLTLLKNIKSHKHELLENPHNKICMICLHELPNDDNNIKQANVFGMYFHITCINIWLNLIDTNSPFKI